MSTSVSSFPEAVAALVRLMADFPAPWALCGGWAVDAWLGQQTRDHGDIDIAVFDERLLFEYLPGWQLLAHDPAWQPADAAWWDGRPLGRPAHIHSRPPELAGSMPEQGIAKSEDGFALEFQIDGLSGDHWVLNAEPSIGLPLDQAIRLSPWGFPAAVPEVLLFYKAMDLRRRDKLDFDVLLPSLSSQQRDWLRGALSLVAHPWLARLSR